MQDQLSIDEQRFILTITKEAEQTITFNNNVRHGWPYVDLENVGAYQQRLHYNDTVFKIIGTRVEDEIHWVAYKKRQHNTFLDLAAGSGMCSRAYAGYIVSPDHDEWKTVAVLEGQSLILNSEKSHETIRIWQDLYPDEVSLLLNNNHESYNDETVTFFVLPFIGDRNLSDFIELKNTSNSPVSSKASNDDFSLKNAATLASGIVADMHRLHRFGLAHLDVKPENIRVDTNTLSAYFVDFERSRRIRKATVNEPKQGSEESFSLEYIPPEKQYDQRSDIFALGAVIGQLFGINTLRTREQKIDQDRFIMPAKLSAVPFDFDSSHDSISQSSGYKKLSNLIVLSGHPDSHLGEVVTNFIRRMSSMKPNARPNAALCDKFFHHLAALIDLVDVGYDKMVLENINQHMLILMQLSKSDRDTENDAVETELVVSSRERDAIKNALENLNKYNSFQVTIKHTKEKLQQLKISLRSRLLGTDKHMLLQRHLPRFLKDCESSTLAYLKSNKSKKDRRVLEACLNQHKENLISNANLSHHRHPTLIRALSMFCQAILSVVTLGSYAIYLWNKQALFQQKTESNRLIDQTTSEIFQNTFKAA